jgi:hypothetical protein
VSGGLSAHGQSPKRSLSEEPQYRPAAHPLSNSAPPPASFPRSAWERNPRRSAAALVPATAAAVTSASGEDSAAGPGAIQSFSDSSNPGARCRHRADRSHPPAWSGEARLKILAVRDSGSTSQTRPAPALKSRGPCACISPSVFPSTGSPPPDRARPPGSRPWGIRRRGNRSTGGTRDIGATDESREEFSGSRLPPTRPQDRGRQGIADQLDQRAGKSDSKEPMTFSRAVAVH